VGGRAARVCRIAQRLFAVRGDTAGIA